MKMVFIHMFFLGIFDKTLMLCEKCSCMIVMWLTVTLLDVPTWKIVQKWASVGSTKKSSYSLMRTYDRQQILN